MLPVIAKHPELLGIGIDESTAIVVRKDEFEVVGVSKVAIYDPAHQPGADGLKYYWLERGERFHLKARRKLVPRAN